jgi:hypothetical protein
MMKLLSISRSLLAALFLLPLIANADTLEGKMNGLNCAISGVVCPIDKADPLIALETDFVVQQPDGTFYIIPNVDRAIKARVILEDVKVTGKVNPTYKSIQADTLEVKRDGEWKLVWSQKMQDELRQELFGKGSS